MTAQARQTQVVELLRRSERLQIAELSAELGVSAMTIRRDLEALAREGLLRRVRGGAVSAISASYEPPFAARVRDHAEAKAAIGAAAAALLHDGETCIVDGGSTGVAIAEGLRGHENVTVCTPSLRVAAVLVDEPGIRLILTGGIVRTGERSLIGQLAEHAFGELRFDIMFLTGSGISVRDGITEWNLDDSRVKRAGVEASRRCIVAADASKVGRAAFARVCPLSAVDVLVTDPSVPRRALADLRDEGIETIVARAAA
jgi:DeoR/GlpR family transcriptional regulator of sugar metabolism